MFISRYLISNNHLIFYRNNNLYRNEIKKLLLIYEKFNFNKFLYFEKT